MVVDLTFWSGGLALGLNVRVFVCLSLSGDFFIFCWGNVFIGVFCF